MAIKGIKKIQVRTVDTDVVVLCAAYFHEIQGLEELWISFGTGTSAKNIPIHSIAERLGPEKCRGLLGFHAMTGCDSNSAFYGQGKKGPWSIWKDNLQFREAFAYISSTPETIPDNIKSLLHAFIVKVYAPDLDEASVNRARFELFHYSGKDFDSMPPTEDAADLHILRAAYVAGHIWGQALLKTPTLPSPSDWGYKQLEDGSWAPIWTTKPTISKKHLHICHCKVRCQPPCTCVVNSVCCT